MTANLFSLCLVTDRRRTAGRPLPNVVEPALRGGADAVHLREKDLDGGALYALACTLRDLCRRYGARLLVNDRIDVALAVGADGVHLPGNSFDPRDARRLLGPAMLIGASAHTLDEARRAAAAGVDYLVFGPIFDTPSKRAFGPPVGVEALAAVTRSVGVPVLGIGGITPQRVATVCAHGARGVAVISAVLEAADPTAAARALRTGCSSPATGERPIPVRGH